MTSVLKSNKSVEITVNLRRLVRKDSWKRKSVKCIKRIRRFIQVQFNSDEDVFISPEVNKYIWTNGATNPPKKLRIKIERVPSNKNPELNMFRVGMVEVNTFKGLKPQSYTE